jgi:hypothetical protein
LAKHKLPRIFAIVGFAIGIALCAAWFYVDSHDVFTRRVYWSSPNGWSGFSTPGYDHFQTLTFALCPTSVILATAMDYSPSRSTTIWVIVLWFIAAVLNGLLYFLAGLPIAYCWTRWHRKRAKGGAL